jgi:hypothetical protein
MRSVFVARVRGGQVEGWTLGGKLPRALYHPAFAVARGRLYVAGGQDGEFVVDVISASIGSDGQLGTWRQEAALPAPRSWHRLLVAGDRLVVAGGGVDWRWFTDGTKRVWHATLGQDGVLAPWQEVESPLPTFFEGGAGVAAGRLYLLGEDGILRSAPLPALGPWRVEETWTSDLPHANSGPVHLYGSCGALVALLRGGNTQSASLDATGKVSGWRVGSRFYGTATGFASAATDEALFALGGTGSTFPIARNPAVFSTQRE